MKPVSVRFEVYLVIIIFWITGCRKSDQEELPVIATDDVEEYSEGIYTLKGTIVNTGGRDIDEHGFYFSESTTPGNTKVIQLGPTSSAGTFSSRVYDVEPGKTYHVKAFAKTQSVTYYGEGKSFVTPDSMVLPVIDIDNNIYYPVKIGEQVWLGENLRVSHYPDGTLIPRIEDRMEWFNMPWYNEAYCWYENYSALADRYGNLYTWPAAMHLSATGDTGNEVVQGVCPDGWHIPSDEEWKQLEIYLGMSPEQADQEKWRGEDEGGKLKLKGAYMWQTPNTGATNESRFRAFPSGWRDGAGYYVNIEKSTRFWSSSIRGDYAWMRQLDYNSCRIFRGTTGVYEGLPVRCIKDKNEER